MFVTIRDIRTMKYLVDETKIKHPYSWSNDKGFAGHYSASKADRIIASNPYEHFVIENV